MRRLFTSESVTEGHPDKLCDQVSDAVLDALLEKDPMARVACETSATTGLLLVMGEISTDAYVDIDGIARGVVKDIGYTSAEMCFDSSTCAVITAVHAQSPDIAMGVDRASDRQEALGAGDQGMMFGFACNETAERMPLPISLAHRLTKRLADVRKGDPKRGEAPSLAWLRPDGKSQVTVRYENGRPVCVDTIVLSAQHAPDVSMAEIRAGILEAVILPVIPKRLMTRATRVLINPTGRFVLGGPAGDTGVTGRKIIVDTYGGYARHGGGAFSGKDPTKVDRSAAYMARYIAKNLVAAGYARRCLVQLAYAIGVAEPVSLLIETYGTGTVPDETLEAMVRGTFELTPRGIIDSLDLRRPIYRQTAAYGHFGRAEPDFSWERVDQAHKLALFNA